MKRIAVIFLSTLLVLVFSSCTYESDVNGVGGNGDMHLETLSEKESEDILSQDISLPIGSVVSLKNHDNKVMVIGVLQSDLSDQTKIYDYSGVDYPIGLLDPDKILLFDEEQISSVTFLGYWDDDQDVLQERIREYSSE